MKTKISPATALVSACLVLIIVIILQHLALREAWRNERYLDRKIQQLTK